MASLLLALPNAAHAADVPGTEQVPNTSGSWFLLSDYPRQAAAEQMEGTVVIRAIIGTDGRLHDCKVIQSSGFELLDNTTCELATRRARYMPAKDQFGDPIESVYQTRVVWKLPSE